MTPGVTFTCCGQSFSRTELDRHLLAEHGISFALYRFGSRETKDTDDFLVSEYTWTHKTGPTVTQTISIRKPKP